MVWVPEAVGKIQGYPKTQEAFDRRQALCREQVVRFNAQGITFRNGVPDGWRRKKKLIIEITANAKADAKVIVDNMIDEKVFEPDCKEARIAMEAAVAIVQAEKHTPHEQKAPLYNGQTRMAAIKTILDFTQKKPATASNVAVSGAEAWLAALAEKPRDE